MVTTSKFDIPSSGKNYYLLSHWRIQYSRFVNQTSPLILFWRGKQPIIPQLNSSWSELQKQSSFGTLEQFCQSESSRRFPWKSELEINSSQSYFFQTKLDWKTTGVDEKWDSHCNSFQKLHWKYCPSGRLSNQVLDEFLGQKQIWLSTLQRKTLCFPHSNWMWRNERNWNSLSWWKNAWNEIESAIRSPRPKLWLQLDSQLVYLEELLQTHFQRQQILSSENSLANQSWDKNERNHLPQNSCCESSKQVPGNSKGAPSQNKNFVHCKIANHNRQIISVNWKHIIFQFFCLPHFLEERLLFFSQTFLFWQGVGFDEVWDPKGQSFKLQARPKNLFSLLICIFTTDL